MVSLPQHSRDDALQGGCGTSCGAGLEKFSPTATAVRYGAMRWIGEFSLRRGSVFHCGGKLVVQTNRGIELGEQVSLTCTGCDRSVSREQIHTYINNSGPEFYRLKSGRVLRQATPQDIDEHARLNARVREDLDRCRLTAAQIGLDMKVVTAEHLLGGERIVFYFRSEERVDFRDLVRELAHYYQTRIEMRQVGHRDEARLVADYEICGRECCCKNFLKKLRPVTMKMAKLQKSTLDPTKVSGRCGRLRCCLRYEHEGYEELQAKLPRIGSFVRTESGVGRVADRQVLTQLVQVRLETEQRDVVVPIEEVLEFDVQPPPRPERPAAAPERRPAPPPPAQAKPPESESQPPEDGPQPGTEAGSADSSSDLPRSAPEDGRRPRGGRRGGFTPRRPPAGAAGGDENAPPLSDGPGPANDGGGHPQGRRRRRRRRPDRDGGS